MKVAVLLLLSLLVVAANGDLFDGINVKPVKDIFGKLKQSIKDLTDKIKLPKLGRRGDESQGQGKNNNSPSNVNGGGQKPPSSGQPQDVQVEQLKRLLSTLTMENENQQEKCGKAADIVFVLDCSSSIDIEDFDKMKTFVKKMIRSFEVSQEKVRIALVSFNRVVSVDLYLDQCKGTFAATKAVDSILGKDTGTLTHKALAAVRTMVLQPSVGMRLDMPNIVIVLTDGRSTNEEKTLMEARKLRATGAVVFSIGIGKYLSDQELQVIATKPSSRFSFRIDSFDGLKDIQALLKERTCKTIIQPPKPLPECTPSHFDIAFILDASGSIPVQGFEIMKKFVSAFLSTFEISPTNTRFALITFNIKPTLEYNLDTFDNYFDMKPVIGELKQGKYGTATNRALALARTDVFTVERMDGETPKKMVILLTDGRSRWPDETETEANRLKDVGVQILTIGIGKTKISELETIASQPASEFNFPVPDFEQIRYIFANLFKKVCEDVPPNPDSQKPITDLIVAPTVSVCEGTADVYFLLEIPEDDEDFRIIKKFIKDIVKRLAINEDGIRVAITLYARALFHVVSFDDMSTEYEINRALRQFELPENRDTSFKKGFGIFENMNSMGWRENGVPKVLVSTFIDNPRENIKSDLLDTFEAMHEKMFTSVVINLGQPWEEGTMALASRPKPRNAIFVPRMDALVNVEDQVITQICEAMKQ